MLKQLRQGRADGVVIHKIDRSARNLRDWADLGELLDRGIDVQFANESLDLQTRGGRLSADIQAVVAADYIRNLREETRKGFYGRIKQGLFPLPAPLGYIDRGKGKPKEFDPDRAPLVRKTFELYGTTRYTLHELAEEMYHRGLRNRRGVRVTVSGLSVLLNNPFYVGLIRLKRSGETFQGAHQPLISVTLFNRVQQILSGKATTRIQQHDFIFRRLLACKTCNYSLIGELQKGSVYYRCHTRECPPTSIREDVAEEGFVRLFEPLEFSSEEKRYIEQKIEKLRKEWADEYTSTKNALTLRLSNLQNRLARLTDAYLDGVIDKGIFEERKAVLLMERREIEEYLGKLKENDRVIPDQLERFLELAGSANLRYQLGITEEKRELLKIVASNRQVEGKKLYFTLSFPFREVANRLKNTNGTPSRNIPRTLDRLLEALMSYFKQNPAPMIDLFSKDASSVMK